MKNIVVVGAGKGIGLATVKALYKKHNVTAISRSESKELEATGVNTINLDVVAGALEALDELPDVIHGLVYCPGSINLRPFNRLTADDFLADFSQNVLGAVGVIQRLLPRLRKAKGSSIVMFSTVASKVGMSFHASVAASKSAVEGLAKSLAAEFAQSKIRVNVIAPSLTDTALAEPLLNSPEKKEAAAKRHPLQAVGDPNKMAALIRFLLEDDSDWITGQVIGVDGGLGSIRNV